VSAATGSQPVGGQPVVDQAGELRSARIESLRAVAALAVYVGHVFGQANAYDPARTQDTFLDRALLGGGFGVYLFFALSGYLLFLPFARRDYAGGRAVDYRRYAQNRAVRILPL
jgi:peptidoglycan/LPS O-acetylase OafA/YrhL